MKKLGSLIDFEAVSRFGLRRPHVWLATWFGCGFLRPAPGTWGSLGALPPGILLLLPDHISVFLPAIIAVTLAGLWAAEKFDREAGGHDSKMIVIDEVAGQWISLLPLLFYGISWPGILLAFVLFRFFDIVKPWPVSFFDRQVKGASGVMGDDIVAGIYAALVLTGIFYGTSG